MIVRRIYEKFLNGNSLTEIADVLADGIQSPAGKKTWYPTTVMSILQNEKNAGDVILRKTYSRDFLTERRVKNTGQTKQREH